jgi:hypothetical protein
MEAILDHLDEVEVENTALLLYTVEPFADWIVDGLSGVLLESLWSFVAGTGQVHVFRLVFVGFHD